MRSADEIKKLIIDKATTDVRIRAVLLNGSRANHKVLTDKYQDFDVVFLVNDFDSFISDHNWVNVFGEKIIQQLPEEMSFGEEQDDKEDKYAFHYLMLFKDGNRIDLTLFSLDKIETDFLFDSLTIVWLDKNNVFSNIGKPNDKDYLIKKQSYPY